MGSEFTIMVIEQEKAYLGWVQEYPLMQPLKGENALALAEQLEREINYLTKDRPDLYPLQIDIQLP